MAQNPTDPDPAARRWRSVPRPEEGFQRVAVKSSARTRKAVILTALILALGGAIAAWVFYPRGMPAASFITIPVREYSNFPFNAFTVEDSELLLKHFPPDLSSKEYDRQERERLLSTLGSLRSRKDKTLVVHLRAHALCDEKSVSILPSDANPGVPASWIPLQTVLEDLRECPAEHKLLLLDIMRPVADARLGILANDVAAGVKETLEKVDTPGLLILCACSPGEVSLVSEDLRLSVFGYYLDQGLSGRADGYNATGARDERVSARELADYVAAHVDRWARSNRGTSQMPVLYGTSDDFPLVGYDKDQMQPLADLPPDAALPDWLTQLWKKRDDWVAQGLHRRLPGAFQQMESLLLLAETRWRSGMEEKRIKQDVDDRLRPIAHLAEEEPGRIPPIEPHSLVLARGRDRPADPGLVEDLRILLTTVAPKSTAKAEDVDKAVKGFVDKVTKPQAPPPPPKAPPAEKGASPASEPPPAPPKPPPPYVEVAAAVFEAAVKDNEPTAKKIRLLARVLDAWQGQTRYIETEYLQRLVRLADTADDSSWPWRADVASQLLATVRQGENAAADPPALPWIKDALQAADQKRRQGEKILFTQRFNFWGKALALLDEAEKAYGTINANIDVLARARQMRDDALAFLPGYVPYVERLPARDLEVDNWRDALGSAVDLYQVLAIPNPALLANLDDQRIRARTGFEKVRRSFVDRGDHFLKQDKEKRATVADHADFERLMASPRLEAAQRVALWSAGRRLARDLLTTTRQTDEAEMAGPPLPAPRGMSGDVAPAGTDVGDPLRRAQLSLDLLTMGGMQETVRLQKTLNKVKAANDTRDAIWHSLAADLYSAWAKELPAQVQRPGTDIMKLDRLSRISGLVGQSQLSVGAIPQIALRIQEVDQYRQWLGKRFQDESVAAGVSTAFGKFCAEAAADYQR